MGNSRFFWGTVMIAAVGFGCGENEKIYEDATKLELLLFTYWLGDGADGQHNFSERLQILLSFFSEKYPDVAIVNGITHWEGGEYEESLAERFAKSAPPDVFQLNASSKMFEHFASDWLAPIDDILDSGFGKLTIESMTLDGKVYGVPVNIQRDNVIYYNKKSFAEANVDSAIITKLKSGTATMDDLFAVAEKVKQFYTSQSDRNGTPFAIYRTVDDKSSDNPGKKFPWTLKDVFIDCMLPGTVGMTEWQKLVGKPGTIDSAIWKTDGVKQAFRNLKRYIDYSNQDFLEDCSDLLSEDDCRDVSPWHTVIEPQGGQNKEAAMTQLGDWYVGSFKAESKVFGTDWDYFVCPGVASLYLAHTDVFVLGKGAPNTAIAKDFLRVMSDPAAQAAFNAISGSLPARTDAEVTEAAGFDGYAQSAKRELTQNGFVWRTEAAFSKDFRENYIDPIGQFATTVLGLSTSDAAFETAVETAALAMADLCVQTKYCKTP